MKSDPLKKEFKKKKKVSRTKKKYIDIKEKKIKLHVVQRPCSITSRNLKRKITIIIEYNNNKSNISRFNRRLVKAPFTRDGVLQPIGWPIGGGRKLGC